MSVISVIIPTRNRKLFLQRALQSVFCQTFQDIEIIVVDDGSDDGTSELHELTEARVRYFKIPHTSGVSTARNLGVSESRSDWIAFLDSDDEWFKRKLDKQLRWIKQNSQFCICQTKEIWVRNGVRVNPPATHQKFGGDLFAASLERCMITPSSVMMKKDLFLDFGGFDESFQACEDYDLWLRITASNQVGLVDEFLMTRYGGHDDQLSSSVVNLDKLRIRSLLKLLYNGQLSEAQTALVKTNLLKRVHIVANGFLKRGNRVLYERFNSIAQQYS